MAKNIAYVHDIALYFDGGAEIATRTIIKTGRELGYNIEIIDVDHPPTQKLRDYDLIVVSNVWRFHQFHLDIIMEAIRTVPYIKYEHDYDGLGSLVQTDSTRDSFPREFYGEKIYRNAALNIFQSPSHKRAYAESFGIDGICMPPMIDVDFFKVDGVERRSNTALVVVPGKCRAESIQEYIQQHPDIQVDMVQRVPHEQIPALYAQYEYFLYLPYRKFPCDRVTFEAALCGCKVVANENVESWGLDLTDADSLREWLREAPYLFWKEVEKIAEAKQ